MSEPKAPEFLSISQFEKFKEDLQTQLNTSLQTTQKRFESLEQNQDATSKALSILSDDVRSIGGEKLSEEDKPKPIAKVNKGKFAFTIFDLFE